MRSFGFGCIGTALGLILGAMLAFGSLQVTGATQAQSTVTPTPVVSQPDVTVTVSAAFLNSQLRQAARQIGMPQPTSLTLASPNLMQVTTSVDVSILGIPATVDANVSTRVSVQRGRIVLTVDKVSSGGIDIPQSLLGADVEKMRATAENQVNRLVQVALQGTGLHVTNVRMTPDAMSIDLSSQ